MTDRFDNESSATKVGHDLKQPINVISLVVDNIYERISPNLSKEDCEYLQAKVQKIHAQIERLSIMLENLKQ